VKKLLKSVYTYGSYRKIKTGLSLFLDHSVGRQNEPAQFWYSHITNCREETQSSTIKLSKSPHWLRSRYTSNTRPTW